jgi:HrpA-like RNA helicase
VADRDVTGLVVLPIYGALTTDMQQRIFRKAPDGVRKVCVCMYV